MGILDEAFDGIATAKANAEKNLQNARALFESHLNSVFTQRGPGWENETSWKESPRLELASETRTTKLKTGRFLFTPAPSVNLEARRF